MDSSDILRKTQAKAIYRFYKETSFESQNVNRTTAASTSPNLTLANHGLNVGDTISFGSIGTGVIWSSLPALATIYYIIAATATTFSFSATSGGSAITWSGTFTSFPTYYGPNTCMTNAAACKSLMPCKITYPSYEIRQQVITGAQACANCSQTGCGCAS